MGKKKGWGCSNKKGDIQPIVLFCWYLGTVHLKSARYFLEKMSIYHVIVAVCLCVCVCV